MVKTKHPSEAVAVRATTPKVIRTSHDERRLRRKQIAAFVAGGATIPEAARTFGVTIRTAQIACQEFDVVPTPPKQPA